MLKTTSQISTSNPAEALQAIGFVPDHIKRKAQSMYKIFGMSKYATNWKKIPGIKDTFSCKVNRNFRILCSSDQAYLFDHDRYETQIKSIKKNKI
ncbi:MAG: hypothetical protein GXY77_01570 [Fibrobacter sp.]|nr:hypothetical protein [Fibrobacter sp.]